MLLSILITLQKRDYLKNSPVTVTREGSVSAPDWRREVEHARKGGRAQRDWGRIRVLKEKEKKVG